MEKITQGHADSQSMDIVKDNINTLKQLFPELITEDANGAKIDVDVLKELVGQQVIDGDKERYNFTWHGKAAARRMAQTPSTGTLRPCKEESKNWDTTQNLFIEGDNLEVLKLLQKSYHKKIKMIYIDPPYNTGKDFIYPDNFRDNIKNYLELTGQVGDEGQKLSANSETSGRYHTHWLNMMYPRLKLARNLLKDDGVIFISIDDSEIENLRKISDEIFGEDNFLAQFVWKCRQFTDSRSVTNISTDHEYILAYSKTDKLCFRGNPRDESKYSNPDNDPRGLWMSRSMLGLATQDQRPNLHYNITDPDTGIEYAPPSTTGWRYSVDRMKSMINEGRVLFPKNKDGRPREKKFRSELVSQFTSFPTVIDRVFTSHGTAAIRNTFGAQIFDFPKPPELLEMLIKQATTDQDIVLDLFAGSCSIAEAIFSSNVRQDRKNNFIAVQLPEPCQPNSQASKLGYQNISEIARARILACSKQILEKYKDDHKVDEMDFGFKYLKLDSSNIKTWDANFENLENSLLSFESNIKKDRSSEDFLLEILIKYGLNICTPCSEINHENGKIFNVGFGALVVCLLDCVQLNIVEVIRDIIATDKPEVVKVVFNDDCFDNDSIKINIMQNLKQIGVNDATSF